MKISTMQKAKKSFQDLKTATENYIQKVEEIASDTELHDKEFLGTVLQDMKAFRLKCEQKLAEE